MKTKSIALFLGVAIGATALTREIFAEEAKTATGPVTRIELPVETATYRPGAGVEKAQALCASCHSADYVATQPPMPRKFWEATVKKMKEKFSAPLPEDVVGLVDYLTSTYGQK